MRDDDDLDYSRREARLVRERDYWADRYRDSRLRLRDQACDDDLACGRRGDRVRDSEAEEEVEEARVERGLLGVAGFGLGGGGVVLVVLGMVLMAVAYFGFGAFDGGGYGAYDADGYSPAVGLYASGYGAGYGSSDLLAQRPMMFMGGGFLFLAGWILAMGSRLRAGIATEV